MNAYFQALKDQYVNGPAVTPLSFADSRTLVFSGMKPDRRATWLMDIETLQEKSDPLSVAILEMNGGLGSSLGLKSQEGHGKSTGVTFDVSMNGGLRTISILEAKFLWLLKNRKRFRSLALIPWNRPETKHGWDEAMKKTWNNVSYAQLFSQNEIEVFSHEIQENFPRFRRGTKEECGKAPAGHGQVLFQLFHHGVLRELHQKGYEVLVLVNADGKNAKPHPQIVAKMHRDKIPAALVTTTQTCIDTKGGILVEHEGRLRLVERAQVMPEQQELFQMSHPFNTNTVYINIPVFLEFLQAVNPAVFLIPELIVNRKNVDGVAVDQLEGAIGSVVVKVPGVKLFHAPVHLRTTEFTPVKFPCDAVYLYDSDAFVFDVTTAELLPQITETLAKFELTDWDGWSDLAKTREAFGKPSMRGLQSLSVRGEVVCANAIFRGNIVIENHSEKRVDLNFLKGLPHESGRLCFENMRISIGKKGDLYTQSL